MGYAYYVYILMCFKNGKFSCLYTGQTNNSYRRMGEHFNNVVTKKKGKFTGRFDYVKPVWKWGVNSRKEALELEKKIKGWKSSKKWDLIKGKIDVKG